MIPAELTIHHAQSHQPWTVAYSPAVVETAYSGGTNGVPHILATHNVLHVMKTAGKLAAVFEELDHTGRPITLMQQEVIKDMAADLVTEALRLANLYSFDLATELVRRVEEKNAINILNAGKS